MFIVHSYAMDMFLTTVCIKKRGAEVKRDKYDNLVHRQAKNCSVCAVVSVSLCASA